MYEIRLRDELINVNFHKASLNNLGIINSGSFEIVIIIVTKFQLNTKAKVSS